MTLPPSDDLLVGLIAILLLPLIAGRILRGLRDGRLPLFRSSIRREDDRTKFAALLVIHALSFFAIGAIAVDLLFNLKLRETL